MRYSLVNPHAYFRNNLVAFGHVIEGCRRAGVAHLVYASSSSVYGANHALPFSEDQNVDHPVSLYAATKKSNELIAHSYSHLYGLPTTALRFFTVYGPWGRPDMAPMLFTKAILAGEPIRVFNRGKMRRDFTYVDDIVEATVRVIEKPPAGAPGAAPAAVYNIGNHEAVELEAFIAILERLLGRDGGQGSTFRCSPATSRRPLPRPTGLPPSPASRRTRRSPKGSRGSSAGIASITVSARHERAPMIESVRAARIAARGTAFEPSSLSR